MQCKLRKLSFYIANIVKYEQGEGKKLVGSDHAPNGQRGKAKTQPAAMWRYHDATEEDFKWTDADACSLWLDFIGCRTTAFGVLP